MWGLLVHERMLKTKGALNFNFNQMALNDWCPANLITSSLTRVPTWISFDC